MKSKHRHIRCSEETGCTAELCKMHKAAAAADSDESSIMHNSHITQVRNHRQCNVRQTTLRYTVDAVSCSSRITVSQRLIHCTVGQIQHKGISIWKYRVTLCSILVDGFLCHMAKDTTA